MNISSFWKDRSSRALLVANLVPLLGVLFFHWSLISIFLSYWVENVVVGYYNVLKMRHAEGAVFVKVEGKEKKIVSSKTPGAVLAPQEEIKKARFVFIPFFILHYGGFTFGHLIIILAVFPLLTDSSIEGLALLRTAMLPMLVTGISLLISHGLSYRENFIGREEYKTANLFLQGIAPYKRIIVMHVSLIAVAFPMALFNYPPIALVFMVGLKILIDYKFHNISHPDLRKTFSETQV